MYPRVCGLERLMFSETRRIREQSNGATICLSCTSDSSHGPVRDDSEALQHPW